MARTQAPDYEQRREAIVDKAAELFARLGFNGASVSDLATACATSKSLIYHYYPSKEDILYAVMVSHLDQLVSDVEQVLERKLEARAALSELIRSFVKHYVGAQERQKVLLNEIGNLPADKREIIVGKQRSIVATVQHFLVRLDPKLKRNPNRARVTTMLLFGMINWMHTWFDPEGPVPPDKVADIVLAKIID